jgi:fumarate hydratase class II
MAQRRKTRPTAGRSKAAGGKTEQETRGAERRGPRIESDSLGELEVPRDALYGVQTERAVRNFPISGLRMPRRFLCALALLKAAAARANGELGLLPRAKSHAIAKAALEVAAGQHLEHFPVDVFQTGSGTSSNMNANEVIARLASGARGAVHPNDHVNMSQSSNDVIPSALQTAAALALEEDLLPSLAHMRSVLEARAAELSAFVKTGRTHLMDAMPLTLGQELETWSAQIASNEARLRDAQRRLVRLPLGGTAIGTGINAPPRFRELALGELTRLTRLRFRSADSLFEGIASQDVSVELSGQLNTLAVTVLKIANDLRWMNSGPLAGLGEIELPALQPGSSIMPGKVNPVIPEAVAMVCAQVMGNHTTVTVAGASGNFQLNVMLPVIAYNLLQSLELLSAAARVLADSALQGFRVRSERIERALASNPILVTALNPVLGYDVGAAIAKRAYAENRPIADVAAEATDLSPETLRDLLDPLQLTRGGIPGKRSRQRRAARR